MDLLDECDAVAVLRCDAALLVFHVYLCADSAAICGFARRILQDGRPGDRGLRRHPAAAADSARDFVRPLAQTKVVRPAGDGGFLREREVLALLATGRTYAQIARELFVSEKTVSVHVSNLLRKTGTNSRVELTQLLGRAAADPQ